MKKRLYPVMLLCLLSLLTACQKAPDEVKVDVTKDNNGNNIIKISSIIAWKTYTRQFIR